MLFGSGWFCDPGKSKESIKVGSTPKRGQVPIETKDLSNQEIQASIFASTS